MKHKSRSNRPLTQFACDSLARCLNHKTVDGFYKVEGNTCASCIAGPRIKAFKVYLHHDEIFSVIIMDSIFMSIRVSVGTVFDERGFPKKTTIERLNGILDEAANWWMLPDGVRIFKDKKEDQYYLGRGDDRIIVGRDYATTMLLKPSRDIFQIEASNLESNNIFDEIHSIAS